ncbi:MAG TPA: glycoside hydrolase family 47 protein [Gemmatimonadales bacterium]|nr:glycoside hydrolase family 47 protein [Gemmatimonadales bacterium]
MRRAARRGPLWAAAVLALAVLAPPSRAQEAPGQEAAAIREAFLHAWTGYERYAWGHDELLPLSRGFRDWHPAPLLMTPVDAYDTMLLLGLTDQAARAKALILDSLSFDRDFDVQVFEITIRLLGGLLSAHQLDGDPRFLALARDLGNRLLPAFGSPTGMPYRFVNLRTGAVSGPVSNPAEVGTLMLEFGTLSKLTGDPRFYDAAKRAVVALYQRRSPVGLVGSTIDVRTGGWVDRDSHVSGGIDSYYEYLLKAWLLFRDPDFQAMWDTSIAAVNRWLADRRPDGLWYGHADMDTGARTATHYGALDAYFAAVLARSGDTARAGQLMESIFRMWTTFGIEPEELDYVTMRPVSAGYELRPEGLESAYYLYRITGDARWRTMGRMMLDSLFRYSRAETGFTALASVVTKERRDRMESYFLAETLKYAYLLFAPASTLDFDAVVFNTEAHPLRRTWP